jgi:hypothetical protein
MPLYTVKIFKSWGARDAERRWSNTYEIQSAATSPAGLGSTVTALVNAEKAFHLEQTNFLSATVSTWEPDSQPYNPDAFTTIELGGVGAAAQGGAENALDSNVCYVLRFMPNTGRAGRRFYRGALLESDIQSGGDLKATLVPGSRLASGGTNLALIITAFAPMTSAGAGADKLVLIHSGGPSPSVVRPVIGVTLGGVSINRRNHRYFDRAVG